MSGEIKENRKRWKDKHILDKWIIGTAFFGPELKYFFQNKKWGYGIQ